MMTAYFVLALAFLVWFAYNTHTVTSMVDGKIKITNKKGQMAVDARKKMIKEMKEIVGEENYKSLYWTVVGFTGIVASLLWPITIGYILGFSQK
ncbi:hypothetical protein HPMBJEAJ_00365 [Aeromonas phage avDM6]|nr:hypothetical protein HPMBJEAJ_00365 [Aeromonas phage avDM6]